MRKLLILLAAVLLLAGCSGKTDGVDISPADAAAAIVEQVTFEDTLVEAEGDIAKGFYQLDEQITDYAVYISGSGATASEVAVLKVADNAAAAHAEEIVRARLDTLVAMFENYRPDEMVKLQDPLIETRGNVVYFVTADDTAQAKDAIDALYTRPK